MIFTLCSLLSGFSFNGEILIAFRVIQASGAVLLFANSTTIVTNAFPKNELGKALSINGMMISVGAVAGPIIGGALTIINWRLIFFVNVPIGIIGTIWSQMQLREINLLPPNQTFDWSGTILFTLGLLIVLLGSTFGAFLGWINPIIILSFALISNLLNGIARGLLLSF